MAQSERAVKVLVLDVGGTHVKVFAAGHPVPVRIDSGTSMTARKMVKDVKRVTADWNYDAVSIGFPGPVVHGRPVAEPRNLGSGWVGFDFQKAFGRPVKVANDAVLQAIGDYHGGRMLFLGFGTGLGTAMIIDGVIEPMEFGHLPYKKGRTYEDYVGTRGLERRGKKKWRQSVIDVSERIRAALQADEVVIGGGNAKLLDEAPTGTRLAGANNAYRGGVRLWRGDKPALKRTAERVR